MNRWAYFILLGFSIGILLQALVLLYTSFPHYEIKNALRAGGIENVTDHVHVQQVVPGSPAAQAGILPRDTIVTINSQPITSIEHFVTTIRTAINQTVTLEVLRNNSTIFISVTPKNPGAQDQGPLGVVVSNIETVPIPTWKLIPTIVYLAYTGQYGTDGPLVATLHLSPFFRLELLISALLHVGVAWLLIRRKKIAVYIFYALTVYSFLLCFYFFYIIFLTANTCSRENIGALTYPCVSPTAFITPVLIIVFTLFLNHQKKHFTSLRHT